MLDNVTKTRIDTARDILVGKVPDPKSQVEQITIALIYKFMDDMDKESVSLGGNATFFSGEYEKYSWSNIFDSRLGGFDVIKLYSEAIEKLNHNPNIPQLFRDIFKNAYLPYRDPETLKLFLKTINEFSYDHSERLGDAFEYLLSVLGSQGDAGMFRTPRHIIDFIVSVLEPKKTDTILDPACGTAGFLISSYKYIVEQNTKKSKGDLLTPTDRKKLMSNFTGYDISPDMVRLSLANMYLHGFSKPYILEYDSLTSEDHWGETFDVILANPPFMSPTGGIRPHKKFTLQVNRSEVLFVDYIAEHINPVSGRAGIIVPEGIIFQSSNAYKQLRKMLVDNHLLYAVVSLPAGVFNPYAGVKTSILLIDKALAKKSDKILFVKIDSDGFDLGAQRREIEKNDLPIAKELILHFKESLLTKSEFISDNKNVFLIDKSKIASKEDYNLSIDRYRIDEYIKRSNFEFVKLDKIFDEIKNGKNVVQFDEVGKYKVTRIQTISDGFVNLDKTKWTNDDVKDSDFMQEGDILLSHINSFEHLGKSAIFSNTLFKVVHGINLIRMRPNRDKVIPVFISCVLKSDNFINNVKKFAQKAVNQASVKTTDLKAIEIPLPPLSVQKEIVAKIENYQAIINGAKQVVENYKPQIDINPNWEIVELGTVCEIISGFSFDSKDFNGKNKIKSIKITNVGVGEFVETSEDNLPEEYLTKHKKFSALEGDIAIALTRTIIGSGLKVTKVPASYLGSLVNQRVALIRSDNNKMLSELVLLQLNSKEAYKYIEEKARSLMQPNLSVRDLALLPVYLPSLEEQQEIVSRIEKEQSIINSIKELIKIYEQKIKDEINKLWKQD